MSGGSGGRARRPSACRRSEPVSRGSARRRSSSASVPSGRTVLPETTRCARGRGARACLSADVGRVYDVPVAAEDVDEDTDVMDRAVLRATTRAATERRMGGSPWFGERACGGCAPIPTQPNCRSGGGGDLLDQGGGRDGRSAREVDDLADVAELVEPSGPVVPHPGHVGGELPDVVALELETLLDEDLVDHPQGADDRHPLGLAEDRLAALLAQVE